MLPTLLILEGILSPKAPSPTAVILDKHPKTKQIYISALSQ